MNKKLIIINHVDHRHMSGVGIRARLLFEWFKDDYSEMIEIPMVLKKKEIINTKLENVKILPSILFPRTRLHIVLKKFIKNKISKICMKNNDIIILGPPRLKYMAVDIFKNNKVILSQTNTINENFKWVNKAEIQDLQEKMNFLKAIVVYTKLDSEELLNILENKGVKTEKIREKIIIIPNPCRISIKKRSKYGKELLYLGRLDDNQKNLESLIKIMKELPDYTLWVYGEGPDKNKLENIENIKLMGKIKNIEKAFENKTLFLMTSHYEGFGNTNIEALSSGVPVILFNSFLAAKTIVDDKKNGRLVEYKKDDLFIKAIREVLNNKENYEKYVQNALIKAENYTLDKVKNKWDKCRR